MAGLPLQQFAQLGFTLAKSLVPDAFTPGCTVRLNPTTVVDPVSDAKTTTWEVEKPGVDLFGFDDEDERDQLPMNVRQRTFLLDPTEFPGVPFQLYTQDAEVVADGVVWSIYRAEIAPAATVVLLYGRC